MLARRQASAGWRHACRQSDDMRTSTTAWPSGEGEMAGPLDELLPLRAGEGGDAGHTYPRQVASILVSATKARAYCLRDWRWAVRRILGTRSAHL